LTYIFLIVKTDIGSTLLGLLFIKTLDEFTLSVKVAEGSPPLPYLGYVEVSISVTFQSDNMMVLLLVVPETDYNKSVPVVIGTNIRGWVHRL
jgi:hypothetical protein